MATWGAAFNSRFSQLIRDNFFLDNKEADVVKEEIRKLATADGQFTAVFRGTRYITFDVVNGEIAGIVQYGG